MDAIGPHLQLLKDMGSTLLSMPTPSRGRHGAIWINFQGARAASEECRHTGANLRSLPSAWQISGFGWLFTTIWEPSSKQTQNWFAHAAHG